MSTPVSPPRKRRRGQGELGERVLVSAATEAAFNERNEQTTKPSRPTLKSPFRLTAIHDLPASANIDTVTVRDIFGDPRVIECWEFNFLHDLDFLMSSFDDGARQRGLNVHVVHGFWKREDSRREQLETAARQYSKDSSQNGGTITLHTAFMPEPFGTHHTKMAVLLRNDDTAQIIIHTANLIPHDWCNMTQAVWRSPLLPLLTSGKTEVKYKEESGVGLRFKYDFLNYLRSYNQRRSVCSPLVEALQKYDFSAVRAVLIGSVPGRHHIPSPEEDELEEKDRQNLTVGDEGRIAHTRWGWLAMKQALKNAPLGSPQATPGQSSPDEIVIQVSSIATLGGTDVWLQKTFFPALSSGKATSKSTPKSSRQAIGFGSLRQPQERPPPKPIFRVMFPTADEIRRSLEGYVSGSSIHAKIQSPQQQRQLAYMRPMMCHWANDSEDGEAITSETGDSKRGAGDAKRRRAAPHVKTYVRYSNCHDGCYIDWALLTSANLSKQAWGEARSAAGEIRIASYELGVLVWPELLTEVPGATMQPVFGRDDFKLDAPTTEEQIGHAVQKDSSSLPVSVTDRSSSIGNGAVDADGLPVVPLRIPYSLPLQRYGANEIPWVTSLPHSEPDWRGMTSVRWED
ncbi:tyrosyl-DNA phosphodiesterase [Sporothrix brasiliensis 5110]|uniref:Tyrosyl-DNA phosphodiesterase n=1 Tax=Sporothrix brasiliensis 5110 TaxID=1398154 RepID=A0A0C2FE39_9PEZI|nr:tyrosyl-DNA phosphodiesterase [Sporothrix brasiliensis 5110]KIH89413.1 tyrosyl-DNA phosphodiesterase [Sporothrix brasiliensis 5110]